MYSRVSVMRGQVVSPQGLGIIGIRVSVDREARFGFTLTRQGGCFKEYNLGPGVATRAVVKYVTHTYIANN
ncbi:putative type 2 transmembrane protein [Danaus plexippus plexippus]|uniref:Type 2 transmembrane protein n=1 Tax=Danaus plexippus plexippus TaxID=278856 RepID=A0A212EM85_DANPL|nr:putative type 2 transmembrane protein [Danaus plexippus plexippus]